MILGITFMPRLAAILALPFFITACGSDDESTTENPFPRTLNLGENYSATFDMTDVEKGVADITVSIESIDGSPLPDERVSVTPLMQMVSGMNHDTPMSVRTGALNESGEFHTTAYFLMPSGDELGAWSFTVEFNGEMETFGVDVDMMMSEREQLNGTEDKILDMSNEPAERPYYIFNEGRHVMNDMDHFTVYIAARETMMKHTSLQTGITLSGQMEMEEEMPMPMMAVEEMPNYDLTVDSVAVHMCAANDCETNEDSWIEAMTVPNFPGQYQAMNLGLSGDDTDVIHLHLSVNSEVKVKSGGEIQWATFTFDGDVNSESEMSHNH